MDQPMGAPGRIRIRANGVDCETAFGSALVDFLKERGQAPARVVVELNGMALSPAEARGVTLKANDRLEIVKIVAGG
jgi:thiamine biosynthesis protein ThiS